MDTAALKEAAERALSQVDMSKVQKPGYLSSELYVVTGTILASFLTSVLGIPVPTELMVSLCTLAGGYLASRTFLKAKTPAK